MKTCFRDFAPKLVNGSCSYLQEILRRSGIQFPYDLRCTYTIVFLRENVKNFYSRSFLGNVGYEFTALLIKIYDIKPDDITLKHFMPKGQKTENPYFVIMCVA